MKKIEKKDKVLNPLKSIHDAISLSSKDYSLDKTDAWVYAITVGWGDCLPSIAKKHKWDKDTINRLKELREQYKRLHENY